jgi:hypothetical protein
MWVDVAEDVEFTIVEFESAETLIVLVIRKSFADFARDWYRVERSSLHHGSPGFRGNDMKRTWRIRSAAGKICFEKEQCCETCWTGRSLHIKANPERRASDSTGHFEGECYHYLHYSLAK